jgi:hypothetical protein
MHAYTEMLESLRNRLIDVFDINPKSTSIEFFGYDINCYGWHIKHKYGLNIFDFNGRVSYDPDRIVLDKDGLQLNIIDFKLENGVTIKKDVLIGLICH